MRRYLRLCVSPVVCGLAMMASGCGSDNESAANIKGEAPPTPIEYSQQRRGSASDAMKSNYPGAAKVAAKVEASAKKAGADAK